MKITIPRIRKPLVDHRPTLVTFSLALAIVVFIGSAIGMLLDQPIQQQSHEAFAAPNKHAVCHTCGGLAEVFLPLFGAVPIIITSPILIFDGSMNITFPDQILL
jgi:hypothetical protein